MLTHQKVIAQYVVGSCDMQLINILKRFIATHRIWLPVHGLKLLQVKV